MKAVVFQDGRLEVRDDLARPVVEGDEALLRVTLAGICATDLEIVKGYAGFQGILGHEFSAVVEEAADVAWIGKRVVGSINIGCGVCDACRSDGPEHCPQRTVLGIHNRPGAFATHVSVPLANLYEVPQHVPDEKAVFTEPLAAAARILEQVPIPPGSRVAVVGPGRMGLLIAQTVGPSGAQVTVLGRRKTSLQRARDLGLRAALVQSCSDDAFDIVVEATGNDGGLAHALRLVRPLGTLVLKSTYAGEAHVDLTKLVVAEITVVGSRCGPFAKALQYLAQDAVQVTPLIDAEYPLSQALAAFEHAARPGVLKVLLRP